MHIEVQVHGSENLEDIAGLHPDNAQLRKENFGNSSLVRKIRR
jgi:hypothetical protein